MCSGWSPSQDGAPPAALIGVLRGVHLALQSVHEVGEVLPTVLTVTLGHRHHADHVTLEVWKLIEVFYTVCDIFISARYIT